MRELKKEHNKLIVLTENTAGSRFLAEHGLSYLIEVDGKTILFDTGHTDVFLQNAKNLGIDINNKIDIIVLSHGHWDHGDGLQYISDKTMLAHPNVFMPRFRKKDTTHIGLKLSKAEMEQRFKLILSAKPYYISDKIIFLGQIPRKNKFEAKTTSFIDDSGNPDFVMDDSALTIIRDNKLIIITGCSHSGICNIIEYACEVTGISEVEMVIGGFHLKQNNLQTMYTIAFLKKHDITRIYPSHCTELPAMNAFYENFNTVQLKTGMTLNL